MKLQWKIYYLCSLYLLLWCAALLCLLAYIVVTAGVRAGTTMYNFISAAVIAALAFKSVLSIRGIGHYKNNTLHSKIERAVFIAGFCLIAIFGIAGFVFCLSVIIPEDFTRQGDGDPRALRDNSEMALDVLLFTTVLCCLFLAIFDIILLKAIRRKYNKSIETIGEHIHP